VRLKSFVLGNENLGGFGMGENSKGGGVQRKIDHGLSEDIREIKMKSETPPVKRSDCIHGIRPCPWIRCKHHMLWAFIPKTGYTGKTNDRLILGFLDNRSDEKILDIIFNSSESCSLDVADRGGATLEEIGEILKVTRERIRQLQYSKKGGAIRRLRHNVKRSYLEDFTE